MNKKTILSCALATRKNVRNLRGASLAAALIVILAITAVTATLGLSIFRPFTDDSGFIQSAPSGVTISTSLGSIIPVNGPLDATNKFFDANFGTNGQACVTCHQPAQGFTIHVDFINNTFAASNGTDPLFRPNDTANNPNVTTVSADDYSLFLNLGVIRIGKTFGVTPPLTVPNFTAVAADQDTITRFASPDVFPLTTDPQQQFAAGGSAAHPTLSLFRRPLVNTNVHLDSSVLWDGRASIGNIRGQVKGAATTLLLAPTPSDADADQVAEFMLGVFTDQVFDASAALPKGAGLLSARGALGGVSNLVALALGPNAPCTSFLSNPCVSGGVGSDIFNAWANLPGGPNGTNAARLSVARGQDIFNNKTLHVPADLQAQLGSASIHCTTCHQTKNVGNNPSGTFFVRIGTDSLEILNGLVAAGHPELQAVVERVKTLPQYCLRPTSDTTAGACGTHLTDVITTDPGRAMVSGNIADVGKFKPPILRGLAARSPYFHAGAAGEIEFVVDFYNARFNIGLNDQEKIDLIAFLETF